MTAEAEHVSATADDPEKQTMQAQIRELQLPQCGSAFFGGSSGF